MRLIFLLVFFFVTSSAQLSRTNYASAFLGAKLVDHHKEAKGPHNVLVDDNEKYMIIPCRAEKKFFTVQLSREIEVEAISIVNREYFSSSVKNFSLVGSNSFPCTQPCMWRVLGHYQANFSKVTQSFSFNSPAAVRYIKFLWATSYGTHQSCTLTQLQVYGSDALDSLTEEILPVARSWSETGRWPLKTNASSTVCLVWEKPEEFCPMIQLKPNPTGFAAHRFARQLKDTQHRVTILNQSVSELSDRTKFASRQSSQLFMDFTVQTGNLSHAIARLNTTVFLLEQEVSSQRAILLVCFLCAIIGIVARD